jgi:1A family penicillin-binding protein
VAIALLCRPGVTAKRVFADDLPPMPGAPEPPSPVRRRRRWPWLLLALACLLAVAVGAAWQTCGFADCPDVTLLDRLQPRAASLLLDRHGTPFAQLSPVEHRVVRLHEMPNHVTEAFLAVEDQRFHEHGGVDLRRVGGALLANLREGGVAEGASTVTMQLARNLFPRALPAEERSVRRKLLEMRVAYAIEDRYSKAEILELYVNHIYFGNGARGIAAGARHYFGREPAELTLEQAALLAALPKAPTHYDPRRHPQAARERRDLVLALMADQGRVAEDVAAAARTRPLGVSRPPRQPGPGEGPWFAAEVRVALEETLGAALWDGPVRVWTTLDLDLQRAAESALLAQLGAVERGAAGQFHGVPYSPAAAEADPHGRYLQGAAVVLDAATGDALAWVGGRDFPRSAFDRVKDGRRQPASAWKPVVYAAAFGEGHQPAELVDDSPLRVPLADGTVWEPKNASGRHDGRVSLREALVRSKNVATVRLAQEIGHEPVAATAEALGLPVPPEHPSAALGTGSVSLLELTAAYTALATLGSRAEPRVVLRVERADGSLLHEAAVRNHAALDPAVAYVTLDILRDALARGTGAAARTAGRTAAGKTGTSDGGADAWFVGVTPRLAAGVWIGFDAPQPIAARASGGRVAAPVWARVVGKAGGTEGDWRQPEGVVELPVDPATGAPIAEGCGTAAAAPRELFLAADLPEARCPGQVAPPVVLAAGADEEDGVGASAEAAVLPEPALAEATPAAAQPPAARAPAGEQERLAAAPRPETSPTAAGVQPPAEQEAAPAAADLDGWWQLSTRVNDSSVPRFEGLELAYRLHLEEEGGRVRGRGQKWSEAGVRLPQARRTAIELTGTYDGERLVLEFTEEGARRSSRGSMTLRTTGGRLTGTFSSDAAGSRGSAALSPLLR